MEFEGKDLKITAGGFFNEVDGKVVEQAELIKQWVNNLNAEMNHFSTDVDPTSETVHYGQDNGFTCTTAPRMLAVSFANDNTEGLLDMPKCGRLALTNLVENRAKKDLYKRYPTELVDSVKLTTARIDTLDTHQRRFVAILNDVNDTVDLDIKAELLYYAVLDFATLYAYIYAKMKMNDPSTKVTEVTDIADIK